MINDFSLDIYAGEIICLLGNNGSGKTTLINLLTGLTEPDEGGDVSIILDNESVSLRKSAAKLRSYVRLCQQNDFLYSELTVRDHLTLVCRLRGIQDVAETIKLKVSEVNLHKDLEK